MKMFKQVRTSIKVAALFVAVAGLVFVGFRLRPQASANVPVAPLTQNAIYYTNQNDNMVTAVNATTGKTIKSVAGAGNGGLITKTSDKLFVAYPTQKVVWAFDTTNAGSFLNVVTKFSNYSTSTGATVGFGTITHIVSDSNNKVYLEEVGTDSKSINIVLFNPNASPSLYRGVSGLIKQITPDDPSTDYPLAVSNNGSMLCYTYLAKNSFNSAAPNQRSVACVDTPRADIKLSNVSATQPQDDFITDLAVTDPDNVGAGSFKVFAIGTDLTQFNVSLAYPGQFTRTDSHAPAYYQVLPNGDMSNSPMVLALNSTNSMLYILSANKIYKRYVSSGDLGPAGNGVYDYAAYAPNGQISVGDNGNVYFVSNHIYSYSPPTNVVTMLPTSSAINPFSIAYGKAPADYILPSIAQYSTGPYVYGALAGTPFHPKDNISVLIKLTNNNPKGSTYSPKFDLVVTPAAVPAGIDPWKIASLGPNLSYDPVKPWLTINVQPGTSVVTWVTLTAPSKAISSKIRFKFEADPDPSGNLAVEYIPTFNIVNINSVAPAVTQLDAPTGITVTPGDKKNTLAWTAAPHATGYKIYRSTTIGAETLLATFTNPDTGLTNGQTYYYKIKATATGYTDSPLSAEYSGRPVAPATTQLGIPTGLTVIPGNTTNALAWSRVSGAVSYNIYRSYWSTTNYSYVSTAFHSAILSYNDTGLTNGTTYTYQVTAVDSNGNSESVRSTEVTGMPVGTGTGSTGTVGGAGCTLPTDLFPSLNNPIITTVDGKKSYAYTVIITSQDTCNYNFKLIPYYRGATFGPYLGTAIIAPNAIYNPSIPLDPNHTGYYVVTVTPTGSTILGSGEITLGLSP